MNQFSILHTLHALPDLGVVAGRLWDGCVNRHAVLPSSTS